ncbi:MAG: exopolyphosphatase [Planctomycetes bacterium]|nr:exopolyphosphatase [Planctomycetota bacterium]NUQ34903.1 exopolyphosphatase [Planctomycetaceae bacterium]
MPQDTARFPTVAAVDLGSNSFHMLVARVVDGHFDVIDRMRERVALAEGLDEKRRLKPDACRRALDCLRRFGQRIHNLPHDRVRCVGTNTLRTARYARPFIAQCEEILGHPIEIIPGKEEARLIYAGVVHSLPEVGGRKLVVDIGGGSTECILGDGLEPLQMDSLQMGCVTFSAQFFKGGMVDKQAYKEAVVAASSELQSIRKRYRELSWDVCYGCSGTIRAVDEVLRANNWANGSGITAKGIKELAKVLWDAKDLEHLKVDGLSDERAPVIAGGVAILQALFESFGISSMTASAEALREGLIFDIIGRIHHEDVRDRTIQRFVERYHVDLGQAGRVERAALALLDQLGNWCPARDQARQYLSWAAKLHEIGLSVSYSGYHKHSSYLVQHSDMPGFSREDQDLLAFLVLNHRRKPRLDMLEKMPQYRVALAMRMCVILRLAVCLARARASKEIGVFSVQASGASVKLAFTPDWLDEHPMTGHDLDDEKSKLRKFGVQLSVK